MKDLEIIVFVDDFADKNKLNDCLYSLLNQTKKNNGITVVDIRNDVNEGEKEEIEIGLLGESSRTNIIKANSIGDFLIHSIAKECSYKYVAFLYANDLVSVDWARLMLKNTNEEDNVIVFPESMNINLQRNKYYLNLEPSLYDYIYDKLDSRSFFYKFASLSGVLNTIKGKVFNTKAICNVLNQNQFYDEMMLDEIFETLLIDKLIDEGATIKKACNAFYFMSDVGNESLYSGNDIYKIRHFFDSFNKDYSSNIPLYNIMGRHAILISRIDKVKKILSNELEYKKIVVKFKNLEVDFCHSIITYLEPSFESFETLKKMICDEETKVVSFDIFDTVIERKVIEPIDVFRYLDEPFNKQIKANNPIQFHNIRRECEKSSRNRVFLTNPQYEDQTIDEIYDEIHRTTNFSDRLLNDMKDLEIELEKRLCKRRDVGYELYELALYAEKKVIFASDMYLPKDVIASILQANGYKYYENIYVSSDIRLGKYTSNLYKYILKKNKLSNNPNYMMHVGDNWISDVENAKKIGINAFHLAKGLDLFKGDNPGIYKGNSFKEIFQPNGSIIDGRCAFDLYSGIRNMVALTVNKFFSNPYINFNKGTSFNANPYLIGYYCVGMHLLAIVNWLYEDVKRKGYKKIHFLGRDGYLPIEAYKIWTKGEDKVPECEYTYMSRYIIPLCDIDSKEDIYNLIEKMNLLTSTPEKIIKMFKCCIPEKKYNDIENILRKRGFIYSKSLENYNSVYSFLKLLSDELIDMRLLENEKSIMTQYFKEVFAENECVFDMGYNGRVETALSSCLSFNIDSYYIHAYRELAYDRSKNIGFSINCFYEFQPVSTFLCREQIFSKLDASIKKIKKDENDDWKLIFGENSISPATEWVTSAIQEGALQFIKDYKLIKDDFACNDNWRRIDASLPFEFYLHKSSYLDRMIFSSVKFEDNFGENVVFNLSEYWNENLKLFKMNEKNVPISVGVNAENEKIRYELSNINAELEYAKSKSNEMKIELEQTQYHLSEIYKSFSYRLAMKITALPRKFRKIFNR